MVFNPHHPFASQYRNRPHHHLPRAPRLLHKFLMCQFDIRPPRNHQKHLHLRSRENLEVVITYYVGYPDTFHIIPMIRSVSLHSKTAEVAKMSFSFQKLTDVLHPTTSFFYISFFHIVSFVQGTFMRWISYIPCAR